MPGEYPIRAARVDELDRLRHIEDEAGTLFTGLGLIDEALDQSFPRETLARLIDAGQVWVACATGDVAVGAVIPAWRSGTGRPGPPDRHASRLR